MFNFNSMYQEVMEKPKQQPKEIHLNLKDSFTFNIDNFLAKFEEINSMSDNELYQLAKATYAMVLESTVAKKDTALAIKLFNNARYITALINVFNSVKLTYSQKVYCNKLVYDYLRIPDRNETIVQLLQSLSNMVNHDIIPSLLGISLPRDLATNIAIARYSSMDDTATVKRVNNIIFNTGDTNLMTEERIIKIYEILYGDCMTRLFKGIMFDVYPKEYLNSCSNECNEIYSTISLAVLTMINTMPSQDIKFILKSYHGDYINFPSYIRFSMNSLSDDFYRINAVINELRSEGIYLP